MIWDSLIHVGGLWMICQLSALAMLQLGSKYIENKTLLHIGNLAHKQKMKALDSYWPLSKIRSALAQNNTTLCQIILTSLIAFKSLMSFVLGALMVIWLPLAAFLVPSIITVHQPGNLALLQKVNRIARWQVSSHTLAAAVGAYFSYYWWINESFMELFIPDLFILSSIFLTCSLVCAWQAGKLETELLTDINI
ncbi:MAG: hypothetical protein ACSHWU_09475 [Marinicella sp.]